MSDLAQYDVRGSVETLHEEMSTWDAKLNTWGPVRRAQSIGFNADGMLNSLDDQYSNGSIAHSRWKRTGNQVMEFTFQLNDGPVDKTVYAYDEMGRHVKTTQFSHDGTQRDSEVFTYDGDKKTKIRFVNLGGTNTAYGIDGTKTAYGALGTTKIKTVYDAHHLPVKAEFLDNNQNVLKSVEFTYDESGRLIREEAHDTSGSGLSLMKLISADRWTTVYMYDAEGRLAERTRTVGLLNEEHTTFVFAERPDPIEEINETRNREASVNENGVVMYSEEKISRQRNRFEYKYDSRGNWIERMISYRLEPQTEFQPSTITHRSITYRA